MIGLKYIEQAGEQRKGVDREREREEKGVETKSEGEKERAKQVAELRELSKKAGGA